MCCEDVAIDWEKKGEAETILLSGASQELVGPDKFRYSLLIGQPDVGTVWVSIDTAAVAGGGILMTPAMPPIILCRSDLGSAIGKGFYCIGAGGATKITVIECLLLPGGICHGKGYG